MEWKSVKDELPIEGLLCDCLLEQSRVVEKLRRFGRLWFVPDGKMYVYYTPTHWKYSESPQL